MNDQQFKIRIKLNQIPQSLEDEHSEEIVDETKSPFEKPPFDWRKIAVAVLLLATVLIGVLYGWVAEENDAAITEYSPAEDTPFSNNDSLSPDKRTESADSSVDNQGTAADSPAHSIEVLPSTKPTISVKPHSKPVIETTPPPDDIIPPKKPQPAK